VRGLLGLVPVVNLVVLLELSGRANRAIRAAGFRVGLLGASLPEEPPDSFLLPPKR
jgi:hypothetical protein